MTQPLISIVTPSFNQAAYLPECLHSVASQRDARFEHVIFDGGSTDESAAILQRFGSAAGQQHVRWTSEKDNGQSDALNKGFRAARGEIIGWLNSDDRYRAGCFRAVAAAFAKHPKVDILYGDYTWMNAEGETIQLRRETSFSRFVLMYHRVLYIPTTALFFRRRIFEEGNFLDERLHYAMDFEFLLRLSMLGYRFVHLPRILADFRFHPTSKTSHFAARQREEQDRAMYRYSPLLRSCSGKWISRPLAQTLRVAAGIRRYAEKTVRGYYFSQFSPKPNS